MCANAYVEFQKRIQSIKRQVFCFCVREFTELQTRANNQRSHRHIQSEVFSVTAVQQLSVISKSKPRDITSFLIQIILSLCLCTVSEKERSGFSFCVREFTELQTSANTQRSQGHIQRVAFTVTVTAISNR